MKSELSARQKINVELSARSSNKKSSKVLKAHIPKEEQASLKLAFTCECADPDCTERIMLTINEYESLHKKYARFVVYRDHISPEIEEVKRDDENLSIVEKYALS
jgi:hypothetical protein